MQITENVYQLEMYFDASKILPMLPIENF